MAVSEASPLCFARDAHICCCWRHCRLQLGRERIVTGSSAKGSNQNLATDVQAFETVQKAKMQRLHEQVEACLGSGVRRCDLVLAV